MEAKSAQAEAPATAAAFRLTIDHRRCTYTAAAFENVKWPRALAHSVMASGDVLSVYVNGRAPT